MPGAFCMDGCCGGGDYTVCGCTLSSATTYTLTASGGASWTLSLEWFDSYEQDVPGTGVTDLGAGWYGCRVEATSLAYVSTPPNVCLGTATRDLPVLFVLDSSGCRLRKFVFGGTGICLGGDCGAPASADYDCSAIAPGATWCVESAFGGTSSFNLTMSASSCSPLSISGTRTGVTYTVTL